MFNRIILVGNLTKDPEVRYTPAGTPVTNFRIAVNHVYKQTNSAGSSEVKKDAMFIDIVTFGKQAETCGQYLSKGGSVLVEGRLQERRWETEDGQQRSKYEVAAQSVRFLSRKQESEGEDLPAEKGDAGGRAQGQAEQYDIEPF